MDASNCLVLTIKITKQLKLSTMAKHKDFFGIAMKGFRQDAKGGQHREHHEPTLAEQLKKYGTPQEKEQVRIMESNQQMNALKVQSFEKPVAFDPYK